MPSRWDLAEEMVEHGDLPVLVIMAEGVRLVGFEVKSWSPVLNPYIPADGRASIIARAMIEAHALVGRGEECL